MLVDFDVIRDTAKFIIRRLTCVIRYVALHARLSAALRFLPGQETFTPSRVSTTSIACTVTRPGIIAEFKNRSGGHATLLGCCLKACTQKHAQGRAALVSDEIGCEWRLPPSTENGKLASGFHEYGSLNVSYYLRRAWYFEWFQQNGLLLLKDRKRACIPVARTINTIVCSRSRNKKDG